MILSRIPGPGLGPRLGFGCGLGLGFPVWLFVAPVFMVGIVGAALGLLARGGVGNGLFVGTPVIALFRRAVAAICLLNVGLPHLARAGTVLF